MGKIILEDVTVKNPITLIGKMAGLCYGSDTSSNEKNYKRGLQCIKDGHGRVLEFPDIYMYLSGYSARVIREWYTHIGGMPTRLQESTRYIDYSSFPYVIPPSIGRNADALKEYEASMGNTRRLIENLVKKYDIPKEDAAMALPLGMKTGVSCKINSRTVMSMAEQRKCNRAYWEYRELMWDFEKAVREYSTEWNVLADYIFVCKCDKTGFCPEGHSCGKMPKKFDQ